MIWLIFLATALVYVAVYYCSRFDDIVFFNEISQRHVIEF